MATEHGPDPGLPNDRVAPRLAAEDVVALVDPAGVEWELTRYPHGKGGQQAGMPDLCFRAKTNRYAPTPKRLFFEWRRWGRSLHTLRKAIEAGDLLTLALTGWPAFEVEVDPLPEAADQETLMICLAGAEQVEAKARAETMALKKRLAEIRTDALEEPR